MRRRAIARTAVVGGVAYAAGKHAAANSQQEPAYEEQAAPPEPQQPVSDPIEQLKQLNELREQGILTDEEFTAEKHKLLGEA